MQRSGIVIILLLLISLILTGCGSCGSSKVNNTFTSVVLSPTSFSLNSGDVVQLSATAQNSANTAVAANITYASSNSAVVTVSNAGLICAGVWDSLTTPINCNGLNGVNPVSGTATITVTAG